MSSHNPSLRTRLLIGAVAGIAGAVVVTAALRNRREGTGDEPDPAIGIACAAACGSMIAAADTRPGQTSGVLAGTGLWLAGLSGWIPPMLEPGSLAQKHRNLAVLGAHLRWGLLTASGLR